MDVRNALLPPLYVVAWVLGAVIGVAMLLVDPIIKLFNPEGGLPYSADPAPPPAVDPTGLPGSVEVSPPSGAELGERGRRIVRAPEPAVENGQGRMASTAVGGETPTPDRVVVDLPADQPEDLSEDAGAGADIGPGSGPAAEPAGSRPRPPTRRPGGRPDTRAAAEQPASPASDRRPSRAAGR